MSILSSIFRVIQAGSEPNSITVPRPESGAPESVLAAGLFPHKITREQLEEAIVRAGPCETIVVLADSRTPSLEHTNAARLLVESDAPESLEAHRDSILVIATLHHDLAEPFVRQAHALQIPYISIYDSVPKGYLASNSLAIRALELEFSLQSEQGWDKWDYGPGDFINLIQLLERTRNLPGSILEIGTFMGSSAGVMLRYLSGARIQKRVDLIDVFDGFVYDEAMASSDRHWAGSHETDGLARVAERLTQSHFAGMPNPDFHLHELNIITQELPPEITHGGLSLVNLDVDLYEAVKAGIEKSHPHLVPGGVLVVEDGGHTPLLTGARLALSDFLASTEAQGFQAIEMESGQVLLIKLR